MEYPINQVKPRKDYQNVYFLELADDNNHCKSTIIMI